MIWPDIEAVDKTKINNIIVHFKTSIIARIVCNTCGVLCSKFENDEAFAVNSTYCEICGNVFCYHCLPVVDEDGRIIEYDETTQLQRLNVTCHLCISCPAAIEASTEVSIYIYFLV